MELTVYHIGLFIRLQWLWVNTSYRLGPSVYALQCLTDKVDDNKKAITSTKVRMVCACMWLR